MSLEAIARTLVRSTSAATAEAATIASRSATETVADVRSTLYDH